MPLFILVVCASAFPTDREKTISQSPENGASKNPPFLNEKSPIVDPAKIGPALEQSSKTKRDVIPWNFNLDPPHYEDLSEEIKPDPHDDIKYKEDP